MSEDYRFIPLNFGGLQEDLSSWESARVVVVPVPYDGTTSFLAGTRHGPLAIIEASTHLELYDEELQAEIASIGIHTLSQIDPVTSRPEEMINRVADIAAGIIAADKFPVLLGGEHSVTLGMVRALQKRPGAFGVVQFDAHADLRDSYQGSPYNHACVARRICEGCHVTQIGIRSLSSEEAAFLKDTDAVDAVTAREIHQNRAWIQKCIEKLPAEIYITIDLDALDPSVMPAVGTPEPGGLGWYDMLGALHTLASRRRIIGFDIVELCPHPGNRAPDFLAAKLCYKLMGYVFAGALTKSKPDV